MRRNLLAAFGLLVAVGGTTGCYHTVLESGRPAGTTVVQKDWVGTYVFGLVAAQPLDVSSQCTSGVAKVETQMSFVNGLASFVTLGLYAPRTVTVTCAATRTGAVVPAGQPVVAASGDTPEARREALTEAARESARLDQPVFVRF